jgi:hypothetical protein
VYGYLGSYIEVDWQSVNDVSASGEQVSQWNTSLDRLIRWNTFLTHVNLNARDQFATEGEKKSDDRDEEGSGELNLI